MSIRKKLLLLPVFSLLWLIAVNNANAADIRLAPLLDPIVAAEPPAESKAGKLASKYMQGGAQPESEWKKKWGIFGGPAILRFSFLTNTAFDPMTKDRGVPRFNQPMALAALMGGGIYGNWRLGFMVMEGSQNQTALIDNKRYNANLFYFGESVLLEYNRTISREYSSRIPYVRFGYLFGGMAGMGTMTMEATGLDMGPTKRWRVDEPVTFLNPYVGVWASPYDWVWFQFDVTYYSAMMNAQNLQNDVGVKMFNGDIPVILGYNFKIIFGTYPNKN